MKKFILFCTLCACAIGVFAKETTPYEITPENMNAVLTDLFTSRLTAADTRTKGSAKKKWQTAFFLTSNNVTWDYINDLTKQLQKQHQKGNLQYAVVLYDRKAKDEPSYRKKEDGVYFYAIGDFAPKATALSKDWKEEAPMYEYCFRPDLSAHEGTVSDLLDTLLSHMNNRTNTYNYFKIHAHGSGVTMAHYGQDKYNFTFKTVHDALKRNAIHIDVLDVHSCMMGTAVNAYNVLADGNVDYLMFASNVGVSPREHANTPILNHLDKTPGPAAQAAAADKFKRDLSRSATNNVMLVSQTNALSLFKTWLTQDYPEHPMDFSQMPPANDETNRQFHNFSLNKLLKEWQKTIPCSFRQRNNNNNNNNNNNCKLQFKASKLRNALQNAILTYRCWDASKQMLYTDVKHIPENSECMDGMSINFKSLRVK